MFFVICSAVAGAFAYWWWRQKEARIKAIGDLWFTARTREALVAISILAILSLFVVLSYNEQTPASVYTLYFSLNVLLFTALFTQMHFFTRGQVLSFTHKGFSQRGLGQVRKVSFDLRFNRYGQNLVYILEFDDGFKIPLTPTDFSKVTLEDLTQLNGIIQHHVTYGLGENLDVTDFDRVESQYVKFIDGICDVLKVE